MLRGANMNLYSDLKWLFVECFQTAVFTTSRAERYAAYKTKVCDSLLIPEIAHTVSRLRSRVNLLVHFKLAFGILFPST